MRQNATQAANEIGRRASRRGSDDLACAFAKSRVKFKASVARIGPTTASPQEDPYGSFLGKAVYRPLFKDVTD